MLTLAHPWLLLAWPLPIIVYYLLPEKPLPSASLQVPFYRQVEATKTHRLGYRISLLLFAWTCFVLACADPAWLGKPQAVSRTGREILLLIDISGSMSVPDQKINGKMVTRLHAVKTVAGQFIDKRQGDKLGLVLFGSQAYLVTPLTYDLKTVKTMLQDSSIGLAGTQTAVGDAIAAGLKHLETAHADNRVMVLLTDGASNHGIDYHQAAQLAAEHQIKIYTIGLGAETMPVRTPFGIQTMSTQLDLDEKALQTIATTTNGRYYRAHDSQQLKKIYQQIDALHPTQNDEAFLRSVTHLYYWPLLLALLIAIIVTLPWQQIIIRRSHV